ncbi:MAG: hypothetical protein HY744_20695, partial [Deltaproteobacteria bacterium]|nr:hypothetical protein [Deltaproteobacteria bacterium]
LGVLLVVGIVVVAIFFMAGKSQSSHAASEGPPESGPSTGGPSTTGTSTGASRDVPSSGSLRDIIPQQVGDYRLQTIQPMTGMGSGVVDALSMVYFTPSGVRANHIVVVFSAAALAEAAMKETTQVVLGKFPGEVKAFAVRNKDNEQVGSGNQILANPESILWTHGKLMATVTTAPGRTEAFYNGVNY